MTTHLEYYSPAQRAAQVEAIRARHAEACGHARAPGLADPAGGPFNPAPQTVSTMLTGDFNFRPDDPLHARLTAPFEDGSVPALEDVWTTLHAGRAQPATTGVHDKVQWPEAFACDFICASADLRPRLRHVGVEARTAASDHQPMLVELG
jgi:endonuclease/exonuclease/phosphatase family metal-dependent hydrolase